MDRLESGVSDLYIESFKTELDQLFNIYCPILCEEFLELRKIRDKMVPIANRCHSLKGSTLPKDREIFNKLNLTLESLKREVSDAHNESNKIFRKMAALTAEMLRNLPFDERNQVINAVNAVIKVGYTEIYDKRRVAGINYYQNYETEFWQLVAIYAAEKSS